MLLTGFASLFYIVHLRFISGPVYYICAILSSFIIGFSHWLASFRITTVSTAELPVKAAAVIIPAALMIFYYMKNKKDIGKNFNSHD
jgi:hypothetical protein